MDYYDEVVEIKNKQAQLATGNESGSENIEEDVPKSSEPEVVIV